MVRAISNGDSAFLLAALGLAIPTWARFNLPASKPLTAAQLCQRQRGTCRTLEASEAPRQGPTLDHVYGRRAGSLKEYAYSPGFAKADCAGDDLHLDAWLTDPQAIVPGANMPSRQAKPEVTAAVIGFLKESK